MASHPAGSGSLEQARALLAEGRYEAAVDVLRPLADGGDPEALVLQSTALRRAGRNRPALAAARQAAHALPSWGPALAAVAAAAAATGRPGEANGVAQQALALAPGDPDVWNAAGLAAMADRDRAEAERCFRHGLGLDPTHPELVANVARLSLQGPAPGESMDGSARASGGGGSSTPFTSFAGPVGGEGAPSGGRFARFVRNSLFVRVLPEDDDHPSEPVLLMAWAGIVVVALGAFLFLLAAR